MVPFVPFDGEREVLIKIKFRLPKGAPLSPNDSLAKGYRLMVVQTAKEMVNAFRKKNSSVLIGLLVSFSIFSKL